MKLLQYALLIMFGVSIQDIAAMNALKVKQTQVKIVDAWQAWWSILEQRRMQHKEWPTLASVSKEFGVTPSQVALYLLQRAGFPRPPADPLELRMIEEVLSYAPNHPRASEIRKLIENAKIALQKNIVEQIKNIYIRDSHLLHLNYPNKSITNEERERWLKSLQGRIDYLLYGIGDEQLKTIKEGIHEKEKEFNDTIGL